MKPDISYGPFCFSATTRRHLALTGLEPLGLHKPLLSQLFRRPALELFTGMLLYADDNTSEFVNGKNHAASRPRSIIISPRYLSCYRVCVDYLFCSRRDSCRRRSVSHTFTTRRVLHLGSMSVAKTSRTRRVLRVLRT